MSPLKRALKMGARQIPYFAANASLNLNESAFCGKASSGW